MNKQQQSFVLLELLRWSRQGLGLEDPGSKLLLEYKTSSIRVNLDQCLSVLDRAFLFSLITLNSPIEFNQAKSSIVDYLFSRLMLGLTLVERLKVKMGKI